MHEDDIFEEEQQIAEERAINIGNAILTRPVGALKRRHAVTVAKHTSIRDAIQQMVESRTGCVLVEDGGRLAGVFTERDVLRKIATSLIDIDRTPVETVMTADPETLSTDAPIAYALNKMSVGGFRHIPLLDADGRPDGVVAMRDIVDFMVDLFPGAVLNLPPEPGGNIARTREGA
jgi:CBS domain-containing protein